MIQTNGLRQQLTTSIFLDMNNTTKDLLKKIQPIFQRKKL